MDEEFALAIGIVATKTRSELPRRDMQAEEPEFMIVDAGVGISELGLAFSKGFDL
ncbi:unannotated protein [freshwater metagenome]|uniref:Unannotated protein n=1 Tax=freshwater metagenome TaxID=449393 RepID=A0A6J7AN19_9ZZZZ